MNVIVISDAHLLKTADGKYWCNTAVHGYEFWQRYTQVFEHVRVAARVRSIESSDGLIRADGNCIEVVELPFVRGARQYMLHFWSFFREIKKIATDEKAAIFRIPSLPSFLLLYVFKKLKRPYVFEVVVDPIDCYADNRIAKWIMTYITKKECMKANGVSYVTQHFLEDRYPCKALRFGESKDYFTSYYSSIKLETNFFYSARNYSKLNKIKIIHVASIINDEVKGHEILLKAAEILLLEGRDVEVSFVGDGLLIPKFKKYVEEHKMDGNIHFLGLFSSKDQIRELLIENDLFVFPTKAEGLPRVLIEAMATGLPCLSTPVNGIPELLDSKYLLDPSDYKGFANKISQLMDSPEEMEVMSMNNIERAKLYTNDVLEKRRNDFYKKLRRLAE